MSHGNQSYLRFTLEESVWFQKGQEVVELVSISLDPNITIQESDQYVTIKGSLELSGEYNREVNEGEEEIDFFTNPKLIQSVEVREEGVHLFSHHFPVEIMIPKNRIQNVNDIDVAVETFDYAFPERSCLKLSADLMITGLYGEQQHELLQEDEDRADSEELEDIEELPEFEPLFQEQITPLAEEISERKFPFAKPAFAEEESSELYKPFAVEARKELQAANQDQDVLEQEDDDQLDETDQQEEVYEQENEIPDKNVYEEEMMNQQEDVLEQDAPEEVVDERGVEEEVEEEVEVEEVVEAVEEEPIKETYPEITFSFKRNEAQKPSSAFEEAIEDDEDEVIFIEHQDEVVGQLEESESSSSSSSEQKGKKKGKNNKWKNKQSLTLSEFFARKEEEAHAKLKVCIVQHGDTLDLLSNRYDITVSQLQKVNQMELNQDIYEGQVLYIPIAQTQR